MYMVATQRSALAPILQHSEKWSLSMWNIQSLHMSLVRTEWSASPGDSDAVCVCVCDPVSRSGLRAAEASQSLCHDACCSEPVQSAMWESGQQVCGEWWTNDPLGQERLPAEFALLCFLYIDTGHNHQRSRNHINILKMYLKDWCALFCINTMISVVSCLVLYWGRAKYTKAH